MKKKIAINVLLAVIFITGIVIASCAIPYVANFWDVYYDGMKYWDPMDEIVVYDYNKCVVCTALIVFCYFSAAVSAAIAVLFNINKK